jgi:hypothetical protein
MDRFETGLGKEKDHRRFPPSTLKSPRLYTSLYYRQINYIDWNDLHLHRLQWPGIGLGLFSSAEKASPALDMRAAGGSFVPASSLASTTSSADGALYKPFGCLFQRDQKKRSLPVWPQGTMNAEHFIHPHEKISV